jgi:hypothetical protein
VHPGHACTQCGGYRRFRIACKLCLFVCPWPAPFTAGRRGSTAVPLDPAAILQQRDEEDRAAMMEMHRRMSAGRRRLSFVPAVCVCVPAVCVCARGVWQERVGHHY